MNVIFPSSAWAQAQPMLALHLASMLAAVLIGAVLLVGRKGHTAHRVLGWTWVSAMAVAAISSLWLGGGSSGIPNWRGFSPIHALTLLVIVTLPLAVLHARAGRVRRHAWTMRSLFFGACVVAGVFTLLPGRLLGGWLWG